MLDGEKLAAAVLMYKNTSCKFLGLSPSQLLFARKLQEGVPMEPESLKLMQK